MLCIEILYLSVWLTLPTVLELSHFPLHLSPCALLSVLPSCLPSAAVSAVSAVSSAVSSLPLLLSPLLPRSLRAPVYGVCLGPAENAFLRARIERRGQCVHELCHEKHGELARLADVLWRK